MEYSYNTYNTFSVPYQKKGKTAESTKKRITNIEFCKSIDRLGLKYNETEQQLLMYTTKFGENILIQYPGKESENSNSKPWDFRPKLLKADGTYMKDLSFSDIWDTLYESFNHLDNKDFILRALATELYKIAFMIGYDYYQSFQSKAANYYHFTNSFSKLFYKHIEKPVYLYQPNRQLLNLLEGNYHNGLGISWEAFLVYNDLLAYNEDCKYFYHGEYNTPKKDGLDYISTGTGRINTILTHISIIGFILNDIKFSDILVKASRTRGIAPASNKELDIILGEYLIK